jgi:hypothetical protein
LARAGVDDLDDDDIDLEGGIDFSIGAPERDDDADDDQFDVPEFLR